MIRLEACDYCGVDEGVMCQSWCLGDVRPEVPSVTELVSRLQIALVEALTPELGRKWALAAVGLE